MINVSESTIIQFLNTGVNFAVLVVIIKATRSVARLELKVEMMWKFFSQRIGFLEDKGKE